VVVSVKEKVPLDGIRYDSMETNASEPLMKCRKRRDDVKTGGWSLIRDKSGGNLFTVQAASGIKVA
jgi:hypothetical protein